MDFNTILTECLKKIIEEAVEAKTAAFAERIKALENTVEELENTLEQQVERHVDSMDLTAKLDYDHITEEILGGREFEGAVRESLITALQRVVSY